MFSTPPPPLNVFHPHMLYEQTFNGVYISPRRQYYCFLAMCVFIKVCLPLLPPSVKLNDLANCLSAWMKMISTLKSSFSPNNWGYFDLRGGPMKEEVYFQKHTYRGSYRISRRGGGRRSEALFF